MEVALVPWPADEQARHHLAAAGCPRLLLVDGTTAPPVVRDPLEDWVRVPASELDMQTRVETLRWRATGRGAEPTIDEHGVIRHHGAWVLVPPVEARLASALIQRYGAVVSRDTLSRSGWPGGAPGRNALDVHVLRLRRRLREVSLAIRTIRSRGYLLEAAATAPMTVAATPKNGRTVKGARPC